MAVSTTIDSTLGVVSTLVTSGNSLVVTGTADFTGATVSGIPTNPNVAEVDDPSISSPETYDCIGGVRAFRVVAALGGAWTIAALTNLSLSAGKSTTIKVLGATASDRTVTLTGMTVDGVAATVNPATVKAKQKGSGIALDVVNSGGSYFVFGSSLASE
jgi:hypothetical protein